MPTTKPLGRNEPCHCGSGKKYKQCCLAKDEAVGREQRSETAEAAPAPPPEPTKAPPAGTRHAKDQSWRRGTQNTRGFQKLNVPRRSGGS